jgi:uncharacterized membrane protein HdeD (DUF308 family)
MTVVDNSVEGSDLLIQNWWAVLIRGLIGIAFGIATFVWPGITLAALVIVFGAYAFADGVLAILSALHRSMQAAPRWITILRGLLGVGAGIITLLWPGITALALLAVFAAWALVGGVLEIAAAIKLRKVITGEWLLALNGLLSIALGLLLLFRPAAGALAVVLWVGAYALVTGGVMTALAFRLRSWRSHGDARGVLTRGSAEPVSHP